LSSKVVTVKSDTELRASILGERATTDGNTASPNNSRHKRSKHFPLNRIELAARLFLENPSARERLVGDGRRNFADKYKAHLGIVVEQLQRSFFSGHRVATLAFFCCS
jgi:hypothetical protein